MMRYKDVADKITQKSGVTHSTMMKSSCLRYKGDFIEMMFEKKDSLIIQGALVILLYRRNLRPIDIEI